MPLRKHLIDHATVDTSYERGWSDLKNGDLLHIAEKEGYDVLMTTDQNLRYQQNLSERQLAIIVLLSTSWPRIQSHIAQIQQTISQVRPNDYIEIAL